MLKIFTICAILLTFSQQVFANQVTWYNQRGIMANGKRMNPNAYTAAHRTARLNSRKTLCNKGKCVTVTITDRCRCNSYDLTPKAFRKLGKLSQGRLTNVRVY